jgi:hypothetical protein
VLGLLGWTYGVLGNREEAQKILKQLDDLAKTTTVPPPAMFYANMGLGNLDATFYYLDKSYRERWNDVVFIKSPPELDVLRSDPRFKALLVKMRLQD